MNENITNTKIMYAYVSIQFQEPYCHAVHCMDLNAHEPELVFINCCSIRAFEVGIKFGDVIKMHKLGHLESRICYV